MESIIATVIPYISSSALPLVVVAIAFLYIQNQRKERSKQIDKNQNLLEYRVEQLEKNKDAVAEAINELKNSVITLQMSVNELVITLKQLEKDKEV